MVQSRQQFYRTFSFCEFVAQYENYSPEARLFELTLPWLIATEKFMLPDKSQVIVHCLYQNNGNQPPVLMVAWPLVHRITNEHVLLNRQISSLSSFYSAIAEPLFFVTPTNESLETLLSYIKNAHQWDSMQLGSFDQGIVTQALAKSFAYQRLFSQTDNIYQTGLSHYEQYYEQRPSQLRNTLKRREKKLRKAHQYRIEIITKTNEFADAFSAYKQIYQLSWKSEEYSFDFIETVCKAALSENKLRMGLLFVDEVPVAAQLWFLQETHHSKTKNTVENNEKTASIFKLAYIPDYQQYSVGSLLSLALSQYVITQDHVTSIEFGMGSEPYKQDWLTSKRSRESYQVFNPRSIYGKLAIIRYIVMPRLKGFFTRKISK